ncbi:IS21 family transposase [Salmonella enterica]
MTLNTSQVSYYMTQRKKGVTQHISAMKAGISVRSGRRIEKDQWSKAGECYWRTRKDPLEAVWDSMLAPLLKERPALMPTTLLEMLQDKYPDQYPNSLLRTMQRRVREWKLLYGAEQEVMFRQRHQPGLRGLLDFTEPKGGVVTIAGKLLAHKLYHFRLEWSHWSWMRAAWKQQGEDGRRELTERNAALCQHYGMQCVHNNAGRGHENGSVESAHGHLKRRIRQALILRGSNDFSTLEEYQAFITQQVMRHNRNNQDLVKEERPHLKPLPLRRRADYDELTVRVSSSSTINVKHVIYSVPSRLVGQLLRVRLWDDRLSCYVGSNEVMSCPRVRPEKGKTRARRIDFRHVIDSLAKKPGAFCHATLRNDILPDDEWRRLWRRLCNHLEPEMAGRLMVHALKLAAGYDDIPVVARGMEQMLNTPGEVDLHRLMRFLGMKEKELPAVSVVQHNLSSYEQLLRGKGGLQ